MTATASATNNALLLRNWIIENHTPAGWTRICLRLMRDFQNMGVNLNAIDSHTDFTADQIMLIHQTAQSLFGVGLPSQFIPHPVQG